MHLFEPDGQPTNQMVTRRRLLVGGAAVGSLVALRGVPALGQTEDDLDPTTTSTSTTTTSTTTTTTPSTTTTTTLPPATTAPDEGPAPAITEPAHGEDDGLTARSFDTLLSESPDRGIMFPVFPNSATSWNRNQDTYGACRSGCSRRHQGEDLMAPKMTKLLACVSGTIVELRHRPQNGLSGGNSLYIRGDDGWFYCYLHINNDRPGTDDASNLVQHTWGPKLQRFATSSTRMDETAARGFRVERGDVVAYNGDSGNAENSGAHLHFEIRKPASGSFNSETSRLWSSASVNPRESLRNAQAAQERAQVPPETFQPWTTSTALINATFPAFLGRAASNSDRSYYGGLLDSGSKSPDWMMQILLESTECDTRTQAIARLYQAFYTRLPDSAGFAYWLDMRRRGGWSLRRVADQFATAPEFRSRYGTLSDSAYVDLVYRNVLGRTAEPAGKQWWLDEMAGGLSRGRVMLGFSESPENVAAQRLRLHIVGCYGVMLGRTPSAHELATWHGAISGSATLADMITMLRVTEEFRTRMA